MTRAEILDLLLSMLSASSGRSRGHWRRILGPLFVFPPDSNPSGNWAFNPRGDDHSVMMAVAAIDVVKTHHPLVDRI